MTEIFHVNKTEPEELYCIEYSEYSFHRNLFPFHMGTLRDAIDHNLRDMYHNHRGDNKWQIVFINTMSECAKALEILCDKKLGIPKKTEKWEDDPRLLHTYDEPPPTL